LDAEPPLAQFILRTCRAGPVKKDTLYVDIVV